MANERISYSAAVAVSNSVSRPCSAAENGGESFQESMPPNTWVCSHTSCKRSRSGSDSFAKVCSARSKKACFQCCSPIASASWAISVNAWSKRRNNSGSVMCFFLIAANSGKPTHYLCIANHWHHIAQPAAQTKGYLKSSAAFATGFSGSLWHTNLTYSLCCKAAFTNEVNSG